MNLRQLITQRFLRRCGFCIVIVAFAVFGYVLSHANPSGEWQAFFPKCIFYMTTGLHCPGCGCTRAIYHLLNGQVLLALQHNAMLIIALPWVILDSMRASFWFLEIPLPRIMIRRFRLQAWQAVAIGVAIVAFWILRNVPYAPFELLAPP
jgi:hypothetical protein